MTTYPYQALKPLYDAAAGSTAPQQSLRRVATADAVGEYVHLLCVKAGQWETLGYRGTWTAES